jgi:hypothetical protein
MPAECGYSRVWNRVAPQLSGEPVLGVALDDLFEKLARDHEGDVRPKYQLLRVRSTV